MNDQASNVHRTMPHSIEAEQGVLGSMLLAHMEVTGEAVERLTEQSFFLLAHAIIYALLVEFWHEQTPADFILITQTLRDRGQLDSVGGPAFVSHLFTFTPTAANAGHYIGIVREKFILRQIIGTCTEYAGRAYDAPQNTEVEQLQDRLEADVLRLPRVGRVEMRGDDPRADTLRALEGLEAIYEGKADAVGIKLGLSPLDKMLGGAAASQMILVAARPSVGKSAIAFNFAESVAVDRKLPVGVFSLEMSQEQQRQRLICSRARVNVERLRERIVTETEWAQLSAAARAVADAPLYIDDERGLSIAEVRARARRWHQRFGLRLLVVDYLQLLKSTSRQALNSREREISEISAGLKSLAGELGVPVLALSQLNRDMEKTRRKPRLSDLRESGSLEADADVVLLLHREEMLAENAEEQAELSGEAELIVAKQRAGPTGPIRLTFLKEFCRFEERAPQKEVRAAKVGEPLPFE